MTSRHEWVGGFVASNRPVASWTGDPYQDLGIIHVFAATAVEHGKRVFDVAMDRSVLMISPATRESEMIVEVGVQFDFATCTPSLQASIAMVQPGKVSEIPFTQSRYVGDAVLDVLHRERLRAWSRQ